MRPKLIYIAGPYTPTEESSVEQNIAAARKVAEQVASPKIFPIVPHNTGTAIEHIGDYQFWINGTIELMHRCDAVLAMPTWERSRGATDEVRDADRVHLPVFYNIPDLIGWVSGYTRPKHGQIGQLADLLAGLPQSISLRNGDRTLEVRDWRKEADDGILYRCHWPERSARIRLTSQFSTFEEVEVAEHVEPATKSPFPVGGGAREPATLRAIILPASVDKVEFSIGFVDPPK